MKDKQPFQYIARISVFRVFCTFRIFFATANAHGRKVQGCQMVSFQTKNPNLGKFWRALDWKMLIYFMALWNILQAFGIFHDNFVHFVFIWYIFPALVSCTKKNLATLERRKVASG
jgi:hypothetical protein